MIRKTVAVLLSLSAAFFACGLLLAPPPTLGAAVILAFQAAAMLAGALFVWPRRARFALPADLFEDRQPAPKAVGPVPLRFGLPWPNPLSGS